VRARQARGGPAQPHPQETKKVSGSQSRAMRGTPMWMLGRKGAALSRRETRALKKKLDPQRSVSLRPILLRQPPPRRLLPARRLPALVPQGLLAGRPGARLLLRLGGLARRGPGPRGVRRRSFPDPCPGGRRSCVAGRFCIWVPPGHRQWAPGRGGGLPGLCGRCVQAGPGRVHPARGRGRGLAGGVGRRGRARPPGRPGRDCAPARPGRHRLRDRGRPAHPPRRPRPGRPGHRPGVRPGPPLHIRGRPRPRARRTGLRQPARHLRRHPGRPPRQRRPARHGLAPHVRGGGRARGAAGGRHGAGPRIPALAGVPGRGRGGRCRSQAAVGPVRPGRAGGRGRP